MKVFIDTNSFFGFFGTDPEMSSLVELKRLIEDENSKIELVVTQQLRDEYNRGVATRIEQSRTSLRKADISFKLNFPDSIKDIGEKTQKEIDTIISGAKKLKEEKTLSFEKKISEAEKIITEVFLLGKDIPCTNEILEKAKERHLRGNPPRKTDRDTSYGDAINWESILSSVDDDLVIVSNDMDYAEPSKKERIINRLLQKEWEGKGKKISLYSHLYSFINTLEKKPVIPQEAILKEIKNSKTMFDAVDLGLGYRVVTTEEVFPFGSVTGSIISPKNFSVTGHPLGNIENFYINADTLAKFTGTEFVDLSTKIDLSTGRYFADNNGLSNITMEPSTDFAIYKPAEDHLLKLDLSYDPAKIIGTIKDASVDADMDTTPTAKKDPPETNPEPKP